MDILGKYILWSIPSWKHGSILFGGCCIHHMDKPLRRCLNLTAATPELNQLKQSQNVFGDVRMLQIAKRRGLRGS